MITKHMEDILFEFSSEIPPPQDRIDAIHKFIAYLERPATERDNVISAKEQMQEIIDYANELNLSDAEFFTAFTMGAAGHAK